MSTFADAALQCGAALDVMKPLARVTRGKTRPGRLAALDLYLAERERSLLQRREGAFERALAVDLGFGDNPSTTLEWARRLRPWGIRLVGVESSERRVRAARPHASAAVSFRHGDFSLPLLPGETVRLVRAMNVLRQYPAAQVAPVHRLLGQALLPRGLLIEGSSDKRGTTLVAHLLRRRERGLRREGMLFCSDLGRGFAPILFRDVLPRDLRRSVVPGGALGEFFWHWTWAWQQARRLAALSPRQAFIASVFGLAARLPGVATDPWLLNHGMLEWKPPGGVAVP